MQQTGLYCKYLKRRKTDIYISDWELEHPWGIFLTRLMNQRTFHLPNFRKKSLTIKTEFLSIEYKSLFMDFGNFQMNHMFTCYKDNIFVFFLIWNIMVYI